MTAEEQRRFRALAQEVERLQRENARVRAERDRAARQSKVPASSEIRSLKAEVARLRFKASVSDLETIKQKVEELGKIAMQAADPPEYRDGWVSGLRQAQDEILKELGVSASGKKLIDGLEEVIKRIERQS